MTKQETNELLTRVVDSLYSLSLVQSMDHDELRKQAEFLVSNPLYRSLSDSIDEIVEVFEKRHGVKTYTFGETLYGESERKNGSWLYQKKNNIPHDYVERYRQFLLSRDGGELGPDAVDYIFDEAEKILALCADPNSQEKKLGLVMGDVQSGKTANYLALANMACDYGYSTIIILSGLTETLRIQTQQRVDNGIVGIVSSSLKNGEIVPLYIGKLDVENAAQHYAVPFTTDQNDFEPSTVTRNDLNKPSVLVVKKNKKVLENVRDWLKLGQNVSEKNILIIDDECDNASVNTKNDSSPTTINRLIREIFNKFPCATYVGYTATPFANIFINPDDADDFKDLFPKDFIHRLKTTSEDYFGIKKVFQGDDSFIVKLDPDEPNFLPAVHAKDDNMYVLPQSLKDAILVFLIDNCVRTLRGDKKEHRSMMINISRFNRIHFKIQRLVNNYIEELCEMIPRYDAYSINSFRKDPDLNRLYELYNSDGFFDEVRQEFAFKDIQNLLGSEIKQFVVSVYNTSVKRNELFNYDNYKDTGARVIIIGGFALSRGLTLRGLMVSYYNRHSEAYDTLLQMCRWFGYRNNYEDLCKIYMTEGNYDCFQVVISAIENLDQQFTDMALQGKTPNDFGLMILESPDIVETKMLVTAKNKSKNAEEVETAINFSGTVCDTTKLFSDPDKIVYNDLLVRGFIKKLTQDGYELQILNNRHIFKDIPSDYIADMVEQIKTPYENHKFNTQSIASFIREREYYKNWDVVFATGDTNQAIEKYTLNDYAGKEILSIYPAQRSFTSEAGDGIITFYRSNNRFIDPRILNAGLNDNQLAVADQNRKNRLDAHPGRTDSFIGKDFLNVPGRNPLLIIVPIHLESKKTDESDEDSKYKLDIIDLVNRSKGFLMGFGVAIPGNSEDRVILKYKANKRKIQELYKEDDDDDDDESV